MESARTPPDLDRDGLEMLLSQVLGCPVELIGAVELRASSRAAPWRIDLDLDGEGASYLLRSGESTNANEVAALEAMADQPIPTPRVIFWDESGATLGTPILVSEFIFGEPLLPAMRRGETWATDLYIDTVCALQTIQPADLPPGTADELAWETIDEVLEAAYRRFEEPSDLHEAVYQRLARTRPVLPDPAFGNGDLWPENMLIRDGRLVAIIDWQHAGWSDPIYEFLLPFFLVPELRGRGTEEAYLERQGYEPTLLHWYHGVEYFDSLSFVVARGKPYEMHTEESLTLDLERWLEGGAVQGGAR